MGIGIAAKCANICRDKVTHDLHPPLTIPGHFNVNTEALVGHTKHAESSKQNPWGHERRAPDARLSGGTARHTSLLWCTESIEI